MYRRATFKLLSYATAVRSPTKRKTQARAERPGLVRFKRQTVRKCRPLFEARSTPARRVRSTCGRFRRRRRKRRRPRRSRRAAPSTPSDRQFTRGRRARSANPIVHVSVRLTVAASGSTYGTSCSIDARIPRGVAIRTGTRGTSSVWSIIAASLGDDDLDDQPRVHHRLVLRPVVRVKRSIGPQITTAIAETVVRASSGCGG